MKKLILLNKQEGETPLQALERFRAENQAYRDIKMTYAGRLDPLVSGIMLILAGDAIREKEKYLGFSKEYEFEILFGFGTDTHDILGKIISYKSPGSIKATEVRRNIKFFSGKFRQQYPLYSSKTIKQARKGQKVKPPEHMVEIKDLKFLKFRKMSGRKILQDIERRIGKVKGDFRQKEILKIWRSRLAGKRSAPFVVGSFYVKCGSGMYVRRLAHDLGEVMGLPALAYRIRRTKIGKFVKIS